MADQGQKKKKRNIIAFLQLERERLVAILGTCRGPMSIFERQNYFFKETIINPKTKEGGKK